MLDKSSEERFAYEQQILDSERQMDEMNRHKRTLLQLLEHLETENRQWIHRMQELNESNVADALEQQQLDEFGGKARYINRLIENDREELVNTFSQATNELEDRRSQLQKERNALPWE